MEEREVIILRKKGEKIEGYKSHEVNNFTNDEIGRASCRERV